MLKIPRRCDDRVASISSIVYVKISLQLAAICLFAIIIGPSVSAQVIATEDAPDIISLDAIQLQRAFPIVKQFLKHHSAKCYNVLFSSSNANLRVDFVAKNELSTRMRKKCGLAIGYILDARGHVIQKVHTRPDEATIVK